MPPGTVLPSRGLNFCIGNLVHEATFVEGARMVSLVMYRDE